jgi:hypothetical protein
MATGWINKSTMPANRTPFGESPDASKAVRRYGVDGSRGDFTHGSTGKTHISEIDRDPNPIAPSAPARSNAKRVPAGGVVKTVGFAPDGSGRYATPDYGKTTRAHGSDGHHDPAKSTDGASGQGFSASGGKFGKPTQRAAASRPSGTRTADAGALAGDSRPRTGYSGGKGPIRP